MADHNGMVRLVLSPGARIKAGTTIGQTGGGGPLPGGGIVISGEDLVNDGTGKMIIEYPYKDD